ncbi:hypothetical protein F7734_49305 [Scytonema sp. UIC 10036]|uniref:hypothetical protein n=1 Tax=Scytonema sp. UIC 10036 TaxID=2304196 RepID=UPI0012DA5D37|nr:hypothetical protein [Scytonema sp. UIC 10036]MUG99854.1 hypothetical protein [Scytonema sp. UIC 10036]
MSLMDAISALSACAAGRSQSFSHFNCHNKRLLGVRWWRCARTKEQEQEHQHGSSGGEKDKSTNKGKVGRFTAKFTTSVCFYYSLSKPLLVSQNRSICTLTRTSPI